MKVGITDRAWERIARSVHFTERREVGAGLQDAGDIGPRLGPHRYIATVPRFAHEPGPDTRAAGRALEV